ncbi:zinc-dependent metalloprotease, partial [Actinomyces sp. MRS3W]|uniref:zinc-dependent metalloprotease n=1 Tax=Actinomyces sp. MRS3W TaxID=2800796 RepID=UPI0028FD05B1
AIPWAASITGLTRQARTAADTTRVLVVDRPGVQRATADFLRAVMQQLPEPQGFMPGPAGGVVRTVATGEVAGLLGMLSTRVLGQVLPVGLDDGGGAGARMLLVAPNVLALQRQRDLDLLDLPAWVALHEAVHVLQLAAAPWLVDYLAGAAHDVAAAIVRSPADDGGPAARMARVARQLRAAVASGDGTGFLAGYLGEAERAQLDVVVATMALLEGHAVAVLDAVEPARMPSVHRLRAVMNHVGDGGAGTVLDRLLGLDAKRRQYVDGAAFVRAVVARVGHAGLNAAWAGPGNLPTRAEIARPQAWIERVVD